MAVPKKRTGHSAQGKRRSNWKANKPEVGVCPNCGQPVMSHTVCTACGQYKGKVVSIKDPNYVEIQEKEVQKVSKKSAPKKKAASKKAKVEEQASETVVESSADVNSKEVVESVNVEAEAESESVSKEITEE